MTILLTRTDPNLVNGATARPHPHIRLCLWYLEIVLPHPLTKEDTVVCMDEPSWS